MLCVTDGKQETRNRGIIREGPGLDVCLWKVEGPDMEGPSVSASMMLMLSVAMYLRNPFEHRNLSTPGSTKKTADGPLL